MLVVIIFFKFYGFELFCYTGIMIHNSFSVCMDALLSITFLVCMRAKQLTASKVLLEKYSICRGLLKKLTRNHKNKTINQKNDKCLDFCLSLNKAIK